MLDADSSRQTHSYRDDTPAHDPSARGGSVAFRLNDRDLRYLDGGMISLTEVLEASDAPQGPDPLDWLRGAGAGFVDQVSATRRLPRPRVVSVRPAGDGEVVLARWEVGLAYAYDVAASIRLTLIAPWEPSPDEDGLPLLDPEWAFDIFRMRCGDAYRVLKPDHEWARGDRRAGLADVASGGRAP